MIELLLTYWWLLLAMVALNALIVAFLQMRWMEAYSRGQRISLAPENRRVFECGMRKKAFLPRAGFTERQADRARVRRWTQLYPFLVVRNVGRMAVWVLLLVEAGVIGFGLLIFLAVGGRA